MLAYNILAGSTDMSVVCRAVDSADGTPETAFDHATTGIDLKYRREGAANVDITEAALAALTTAHTDGGVEQIGNGYFRLDLPDAAIAAGVSGVLVHGVATGMIIVGCYVNLTPVPVDVRQLLGTAWLAPGTAGTPDVNTKLAAGTAWGSGAITAASIASDAITDAKVASDVTIASVTGAVGSVTGAVGSVTGAVGSVTGAVGSVTAAVTLPTIPAAWITADGIAANAIGASELAADAVTEIQAGLATPTNITAGTITTVTTLTNLPAITTDWLTATGIAANAITDAKVASDVTIASVTGAVGSVTGAVGSVTGAVGSVTGAVGSVTAAVTLPTIPTAWITADGIAANAIGASELAADAVTEIQSGLATPTNITAGVITTVTNLTNAPTTGDLTATMKTSVTTAATASTPTLSAAGSVALTEGYAADGATGTLPQLLYMLLAMITEKSVAGTTLTAKKLDGSTTAGTFTLSSATEPTSITRAT